MNALYRNIARAVPVTALILLSAGRGVAEPAASRPYRIEHLGQPCRALQVLAGRVVVDRADGRDRLVLVNDNESQGAELLYIDFEKNTGRMFPAPAGAGGWALREVPGDRLVVGTFYDGVFMIFDLKKMAFLKTIDFPGESYVWNLALGADGRIYGGTYRGAKLGALDLQTYAFEDLGAPAPPNLYLRQVSATPEGLILCSFGTQEPKVLLFDPASKTFAAPPPQLKGASAGVAWNGYFLAGNRAYKGRAFERVDPPPFPAPPPANGTWSVQTYLTTDTVLFLQQGHAVYRYVAGDKDLTFIAKIDLRGGRLLAGTRNGHVLGLRGQDYFLIKPGDKELNLRPIPVKSRPRPTLFLKADNHGRLWGGPHFGQTLFYLDLQTGKAVNTSKICDAGGEVYDVAFIGRTVCAASYAGGDITRYDPKAPWDQWNDRNPKHVARVSPAYIRPIGGIRVGPDGKLYSGWMARYGTYGGAVAITDPATGETTLIENPLGNQAVAGLAVDHAHAYVGTTLGANGLPNKPKESPRFGMIELATQKVVFKQEFQGAGSVGHVHYEKKNKVVVMVVGGTLRTFVPAEKKLGDPWPEGPPKITGSSIAVPGDGNVYAGSGKTVLAIDPVNRTAVPLAQLPANVSNVTVDSAGVVFVSCDEDIYRIHADLPTPSSHSRRNGDTDAQALDVQGRAK